MKDNQRKRYSPFATTIAVATIFGLGLWWNALNTTPQIAIPTAPMPSPNAFDTYNLAYKQMVPRPQSLYEPAPKRNPQDKKPRPPRSLAERLVFYRRADLRAWLTKNNAALKTLRHGFALEYRQPAVRSWGESPHYASAREMARTLNAESQIRAARGDWNGATQSAIDILELGHDLPRGAPLIGALVGYAIEAIARSSLRDFIPQLNAAQCRSAARRMEKIYETRLPLVEVFREAKWANQATLLKMMNEGNWTKSTRELLTLAPLKVRLKPRSKRAVMNGVTLYSDALIAEAQKPFAPAKPPAEPKDELVSLFVSNYNSTRWSHARAETNHALLMLMLALRAYQLEHGAYPEKLDALVPGYLKAIPADGFGNGGPFRYKKDGAAYKLWSIGPDGIDDGGKPIDNEPQFGKIERPRRRWSIRGSTGDVVAGIND